MNENAIDSENISKPAKVDPVPLFPKVHLKHILDKLGASDRTHAITIAARRGFIHL